MSQAARLMFHHRPAQRRTVICKRFDVWPKFGALLGLTVLIGCGGEDRLEVAPVHGRIVYKNKGVPRATIIFFPEGEAANVLGRMRPFAYSDDDGNFQIKTYVEGDGAPPGDYRVSVIAPVASGVKQVRTKDGRGGSESSTPGVGIPLALSQKYSNVETSGIKVTIQEGENKLEPFSL